MEKRASHFEDHMEIVQAAHTKTAGGDPKDGGSQTEPSLLDKLASELGIEGEKTAQVTASAAPKAEGEVSPAESTVATAAPAVVAATEAVATPQTAIAGGNPAEAAAGEVPAATKTNEGTAVSAGDGKVTDATNLHRTPEAVEAAARGGGGEEGAAAAAPAPQKAAQVPDNDLEGTKTAEEANKIGKTIAASFQAELEKNAQEQEYVEALGILKEAGLLEGYNIKDEGMSKTASELPTGCLEKISQKQPLSKREIVGAACELIELQKEAEDAEQQGREDARALVELLTKVSGDGAGEGETAAAPAEGAEAAAAPAAGGETATAPATGQPAAGGETAASSAGESGGDSEKVAALLQKPEVVKAVRTLREHGVIS